MKKSYKVIAAAICFSMISGLFPGTQAFAAEDSANKGEPGVVDTAEDLEALLPTGYKAPEGIEISWDEIKTDTASPTSETASYMSHPSVESKYSAYTCDYFYDQMSDAYKESYDLLFESCVELMEDSTTSDLQYTEFAPVGTKEEAENFILVFMFANPQFYFCTGTWWYSYDEDGLYYAALGVDDTFQDPDSRAAATNSVFSMADSIIAEMDEQDSTYQREKYAHDWLVENVEYDYDGMTSNSLNQSCFSALLTGLSVCAGYGDTFAMLCNGSGIPCICVSSFDHEWNVVQLYGKWYVVDCTWDDNGDGYPISYEHFNLSYEELDSLGDYTALHHTYEEFWDDYEMPDCSTHFEYDPDTMGIHVTGVSLDEDATVTAGKTLALTAEILPANADNQKVTWSLADYHDDENNIDRASINPETGVLTTYSAGRVTVIATTKDGGYTAECSVLIRFSDVTKPSEFWYEPVYWASDAGITYGIKNSNGFYTTFGPKRTCTRSQMVTFLWRLAGCPEPETSVSPFSDVTDTSAYYYKAVLWAAENKITEGYADGTFKPSGKCLRRQAVMFLWRMAGKPEVVPEYVFADVPEYKADGSENIWYAPVMWAANNGITTGVVGSDPLIFNEGGECMRRQMVTFLYRYNSLMSAE